MIRNLIVSKFFAEALYEAGVCDLVSVIPPGAQLTPTSKIPQAHVGKVPGRRLSNGLYAGYNWRAESPSIDEVRQWCIDGSNIGLRADRFPAIDIDCKDFTLAQMIEEAAIGWLGTAPVRIGKAPKRLLAYRTDEPFGRMRLWIKRGDENHLVEILCQGQQYLVAGTHPGTMRAYEWMTDPVSIGAAGLTPITRESAAKFLSQLSDLLESAGYRTDREGDGRPLTRTAVLDQAALRAPSIEALREAVEMIPNTNDLFPDRTSYLRMAYAIRAAAGDEAEDGFEIFAAWADKWEGNARFSGNDPDTVRSDWRRIHAPYAVGWSWIAENARACGYNDAGTEFDALIAPPASETPSAAPKYSEQWMADRIVDRRRGDLRYSPESGRAYVWHAGRWQPDAELLAEDLIKKELRDIASMMLREGATDKEKKAAEERAVITCSAKKAASVWKLVQSERAIAIAISALDNDPWILNTPAGIVNLRTGELGPADPDALCTKSTSVPADFNGACPEWRRFLAEATGGDRDLEAYLQRLAGYALTGSTEEQALTFVHGPGGNGKSVFLNAISGILGDYARVATMDTFTASHNDKHTTDIAMLTGARLVTASETQAGKRWDEARVKALTGGEPITARFMRQDNFTFIPQFKLLFVGNHRPEVRDVDAAMRRRIQLVPFTVTPAVVDKRLGEKLREEWPAILAWMIEGCLAWQKGGLKPPAMVRAATDEYFSDEDAIGRWLAECTERDDASNATTASLYESWREWANANGEYPGSLKRLSAALVTRKVPRWRERSTRRMGFSGLRILDRQYDGIGL